MKNKHVIAGLVAAVALAVGAAQAQTASKYPDKPIRLLLPFPPGGSSDTVARVLGPVMAERLGQPVVIENKPGAGGAIALDTVARSNPDGYTLGVGTTGGLGVAKLIGTPQPYDAFKDLTPVGLMVTNPFIVVANPNAKITNLAELIAAAKASNGGLSIGHGGNGSVMHLSAELLKQMTSAELVSVPYRGTAPATTDALAGQLPLAMSDIPASLQHIQAGTLKAVAVTTPKRSVTLPNVPTFAELGVANYDATGWMGIVAPAKTPPEVIERLNRALNFALENKDVRDKILSVGADPAGGTTKQMAQIMKTDYDKWAKVIKTAKIKAD